MDSLDLVANNIANAETAGYKGDREFYSLYASSGASGAHSLDASQMPVIEKTFIDYTQGVITTTSNPLDFAIQGSGFFEVDAPGGPSYTRNGIFRMSASGTIVNEDGYSVLSSNGQPISVNPALPVTVLPDGTIIQSGQPLGQMALVEFTPGDLIKKGKMMFRPGSPGVKPKPGTGQILQGKTEGSNVTSSESTVRLVNVMRQFEMLQKAANIAGEMDRKAITDVAKTGI